ncbi:kelch repeat-containing protein [Bacteroidota bacterium]
MKHRKRKLEMLVFTTFILSSSVVFSQVTWDSLAPLNNAPGIPAVAAANGKLYVMSGALGTNVPTWEYNPATNTWAQKQGIPNGCYWSTAVTVNNKIYVMGGGHPYPGQKYNYIYDPSTDSWTSGADLLTGRMYHSAAAANGKIYLMGGQNGDGTSEWYFEEYNPVNDSWSTKAQLPHNGAWYCGAAGIGNYIYRIAGGGSSNTLIKDWFDVYNTTTNTWVTKEKFHKGLHAPAAVTINEEIYLFGGYSNFTYMDSVWIYNTITETWSNATFKMREPRSYHRAVIIDSCLYIFSGMNSMAGLDSSLTRFCNPSIINIEEINLSKEQLKIYPNPSDGNFTIEMTNNPFDKIEISVINSIGQEIYNNNVKPIYSDIHISIGKDIPAGIYIVRLVSKNNIRNQQLIIQ